MKKYLCLILFMTLSCIAAQHFLVPGGITFEESVQVQKAPRLAYEQQKRLTALSSMIMVVNDASLDTLESDPLTPETAKM